MPTERDRRNFDRFKASLSRSTARDGTPQRLRARDFEPGALFDLESAPQDVRALLTFLASRLDASDWAQLQLLLNEGEESVDDEAEPETERRLDQPAIDRRRAAMDAAYSSPAERSFRALFPDAQRVQGA